MDAPVREIGEVTVTVVGVFAARAPAEENVLYTHLGFLQRVRGRNVGEAIIFFGSARLQAASRSERTRRARYARRPSACVRR